MPEETVMHEAPTTRPGATRLLWLLASLVIAAVLTLAVLAFAGMFTAVKAEMVPFYHRIAWIVPIGVDVGIIALTGFELLFQRLEMPMPLLRWAALTFMGFSVWLNVGAADGNPQGVVAHAALPLMFITCIEAMRHWVRCSTGMASGNVRDGIPVARWILAPVSSFLMFRRMVLQKVYSYPVAVETELQRQRDIAALRTLYGKKWRTEAPGDIVWMLRGRKSLTEATARVRLLTTNAPAVPARRVPGSAGATGTATATVPADAPVHGSRFPADGSGSAALRQGTSTAPVVRNRLRDAGELLAEARGINEAWRQVHGKDISADALRKRMSIQKQAACGLLRQIKAENVPATTGAEESAR